MFTVKIETENDSFADGNLPNEVARILEKIASHMRELQPTGTGPGYAHDSNGNRVAEFELHAN